METTPHLPNTPRPAGSVLLMVCFLGFAACQDRPVQTNAAEDARISRSMEDVAAGQAKSEADVDNIEAARRQAAKEKQKTATR